MIFSNKLTIKQTLEQSNMGDIITIYGWVRNKRDSKSGLSFIDLTDGSSIKPTQIIATKDELANYSEILKLTKDCSITVTGKLTPSPAKEQTIEILASEINIIGWVENPDTYPVAAKKHSVEHLRDVAHLRIRTNLISSIMRVRNTVSFAMHEYLQQKGFNWIHTPIITASDAEGAGELFRVTTLNPQNHLSKDSNSTYTNDFFGQEAFLTVSGQLNLEAYCMGLSKVYTFAPTFRAEISNTTRHLAEFWMVEPEIAFANLNDAALLAQNILKHVFNQVLEKNSDDMEFFAKFVNSEVINRLTNITQQGFEMLTYTEAVKQLQQATKVFEQPVQWGQDLSSEHERWLCEELVSKPVIVTDYPKEIKAFYMRQNDDGKTVSAMDILAPGIGEIAGGSAREERYDRLVEKVTQLNLNQAHLAWYLDLRRFGSVPHAGFGLGLERVISYITGVQNVRDIIPFPRSNGNIKF